MSIKDYNVEQRSKHNTIAMLDNIYQRAEAYAMQSRKKVIGHDTTKKAKITNPKKINGVAFELQTGHQPIVNPKPHYQIKDDAEDLYTLKNQSTENKPTTLDFRKTVRNIQFKKYLARKPLIKGSEKAISRYARSYNVKWQAVEKRQDVNCIQFGKTKGRDFICREHHPTSTDGYYEILDYVANKDANTRRINTRDRTTTASGFYQTTSDYRTTTQMISQGLQTKSGFTIDFGKTLPRSLSQKSKLPSFMQKGTSCSRFSIEHIKADLMDTRDEPVPQVVAENTQKLTNLLSYRKEESFDDFFGES